MAYNAEYERGAPRQSLGRGWIGWLLLAIVAVVITVLAFAPSNFVIERPGPVYDTLGTISADGDTVPLVDIPMQETFPTTGSLDMLTVTTYGNRESHVSWLEIAKAWLDKSQAIINVDVAFPNGETGEQSAEVGQAQMVQSQQEAIAAALSATGYEYETAITVAATTKDGPSDGLILPKDVVTAVNGKPVDDPDQLRALLDKNGTEAPATISVLRDAAPLDVQVTPVLSTAETPTPILGIQITTSYTFPFEVTIQAGDIGGPSAGQMFALAVIDKLTPGSLNGGAAVAGTGTITESGVIGPIGGIRQKLYGAQRAGADYFLAPASNCDEVVGHIPAGLSVFAVSTLADSVSVLTAISTGASTALLPRCAVS